MEDGLKPPKKKKLKKDPANGVPKSFEALAKLTSSDVIRQVKAGMSRIAPIEENDEPTEDVQL
jgi:hypothetical protein